MAFRIAGECVKLRRNACRYTSWTKLTLSRLLYRTSRTKCIAAAYGSSLKYNYSTIKLQLSCNFYIMSEFILLCCAKLVVIYILPTSTTNKQFIVFDGNTGCPRRKGPNFGRVFLRSNYNDITQTPISKVQWLWRYWPEKFETLTAITHLLITKYILKLAGICGFCNVNICT